MHVSDAEIRKLDKKAVKLCLVVGVAEPGTLKEAIMSPNAKEWQEVVDLEYESLLEMRRGI